VFLTLLDSYPPAVIATDELGTVPSEQGLLAGMLVAVGGEVDSHAIAADAVLKRARETGHFVGGFSAEDVMRLVSVSQHTARLVASFTPGLFAGDVLFIEATEEDRAFSPEAWRSHVAGRLDIRKVSCKHREIIRPDVLAEIGRFLQEILETGETS
jgi:thioesterase domain-containing protein